MDVAFGRAAPCVARLPAMDDDIAAYLAKASESLLTAESEFAHGRYNSCANRCYYACFQAAIAALIRESIQPHGKWSHESVQAQFTGQLINRRKRFGAELGRGLIENRTLRERADYQPVSVSQIQASRALGRARTFVTVVNQGRDENR
jgi:uncharacterized protein (UPF0332 family)